MALMPVVNIRREIRESLEGFYRDGGQEFWRIYRETPRAAVAAFKAKPEVFGALDTLYANWPKSRLREHNRISALLHLLIAARNAGDASACWPD